MQQLEPPPPTQEEAQAKPNPGPLAMLIPDRPQPPAEAAAPAEMPVDPAQPEAGCLEAVARQAPDKTLASLSFPSVAAKLAEIMQTIDVDTGTFGQVRVELARRLGVAEAVLEPWREHIFDMLTRQLQARDGVTAGSGEVEQPAKNWRRQYLGSWSHTSDPEKKAPKDMDKASFGELVLAVSGSLFKAAARSGKRARLNAMDKVSVWEEKHANGELHYHFPCLANDTWSFVPLARALRKEGIYVDFSCEHDYYWTPRWQAAGRLRS